MESPPPLELGRFDPASIADDSLVLVLGLRDTGKTFVLRDILRHHRDLPVSTAITWGGGQAVEFWSEFVPPKAIHHLEAAALPSVLKGVIDRQRLAVRGGVRDPRALLVLDDCFDCREAVAWRADRSVRAAVVNGRDLRLLLLMTAQWPEAVPPMLRTADYVFILRQNLTNTRRRLYEELCADVFPTFDVFCHAMDQCTANCGCLVLARRAPGEDRVFWYRTGPSRIPPWISVDAGIV